MKKLVANAAIAAMFVLGSVWQAQAQGKVKIAIWDFENHSEQSWWFSNKLGPAARDQIDTEFSENPKLSAKFSVIERDKLDLVMKEQGLGASGALDPQTAAKVGRILGVRYILTGAIDKFDINNTKGGFGPIGGHLVQADATINIRLIDTTTAERIVSVAADGQVKKGGGFIKSANLSRDSEWGIASEAVQKTAKEVVAKFVDGGYLDKISSTIAPTAIEGKIIRVEGNKAYINLGADAGLKVGDKFNVFNVGESLVDPDTGAKLGAEEKQTGTCSVTEVQAKFAVVTFTGTVKPKDTIRKQ